MRSRRRSRPVPITSGEMRSKERRRESTTGSWTSVISSRDAIDPRFHDRCQDTGDLVVHQRDRVSTERIVLRLLDQGQRAGPGEYPQSADVLARALDAHACRVLADRVLQVLIVEEVVCRSFPESSLAVLHGGGVPLLRVVHGHAERAKHPERSEERRVGKEGSDG